MIDKEKVNVIVGKIIKKPDADAYIINYLNGEDTYHIEGMLLARFDEEDLDLSEDLNLVDFINESANLIQSQANRLKKYIFIYDSDVTDDDDNFIIIGRLRRYNYFNIGAGQTVLNFKFNGISKNEGEEVDIYNFPKDEFQMAFKSYIENLIQ